MPDHAHRPQTDADAIARAVEALRDGGLVAMPTETVYGLAARAADERAIAAVYALKGRPAGNPLILHAADEAMARGCCDAWPAEASRIAAALWPGPVTLVLPRASWVPRIATGGRDRVAVRVPAHPLALALLAGLGEPVVAPSANRSGAVSPTTADHVREAFASAGVLVLDGGPCGVGLESTVVDLASPHPRVLRPGVVGADELASIIGRPVATDAPAHAATTDGTDGADGAAAGDAADGPASPGLVGPHYQPAAPVVLVDSLADAGAAAERAGRAAVLLPPGVGGQLPEPHASVAMPADGPGYGRRLYAALREADGSAPDAIIVCRPPLGPDAAWHAVADRLARASAGGLPGGRALP